jgi:hypothetical protein
MSTTTGTLASSTSQTQVQNAASVSNMSLGVRHIFGVSTTVYDNLSFTDDDSIVYVAGHGLVVYSLTERRQRFLHSSEISDSITCYTSGSGKRLCAVAERGEGPTIHVFDLRTFRRKKSVNIPDIQSKVSKCT